MVAQEFQAYVYEDGTAYAMARLKRKDSSHNLVIVAQANFTSISRKVIRKSDLSTVIGPTTLTTTTVIINSLSTGTIWTKDTTGFNFIDTVPTTAFPVGGEDYNLEYTFTLTGGEVFPLVIRCSAIQVLTG